jgi:hypothetical protein
MDIFKMSKNENPKIVLKKVHFPDTLDHNAVIFGLRVEKSVTIKFLYIFRKKAFRRFLYHNCI